VEGEIHEYRNQSNQDPLNFGIKLNNKLAALMGVVESADARPTDQSYAVFEDLSARLAVQLGRMNELLDRDLAQFNELLRARNLPPVRREPLRTERVAADGAES